jgi:hypothetical protein
MDDWLHPGGNPQPQGWVIPESLRTRVSEPVAGALDEQPPADRLPDYSQPASYAASTHAPAYPDGGHAGPQQQPTTGYQQYGPPTGYPIQGGYLPGGPGLPPWLATQPVRRRSRAKLVVAIAGGLVLSLLVLAVVLGALQRAGSDGLGASDNHRLTLPDRTDGYVRINTQVALDLGKTMSDQVKTAGGMLWTKPMIGIYGSTSTGDPSMVFLGGDGASNPKLRSQLRAAPLNVAIDGFMAGAQVSQSTDYPPGKFGGLLRCGMINGDESACVWVDRSTLGTLELLHPPSLAEAASIALNFRNATEH